MKAIDRWIQSYRFNVASQHIPDGSRVLDVGSSDGALFRHLGARLGSGVGIDEDVAENADFGTFSLAKGLFPADLPAGEPFDAITMLAMLEHVRPEHQPALAEACFDHLKPGGWVVLTVPSPFVDHILAALIKLRLIDGMVVYQHYGFRPERTPAIFEPAGFELVKQRRFQLGLNHLFVFRRAAEPVSAADEHARQNPADSRKLLGQLTSSFRKSLQRHSTSSQMTDVVTLDGEETAEK